MTNDQAIASEFDSNAFTTKIENNYKKKSIKMLMMAYFTGIKLPPVLNYYYHSRAITQRHSLRKFMYQI